VSREVEPLLTIDEVAEYFGLNRKTIGRYVQRGELEGRLIGRRWRFSPDAVRRFFDNAPSQWDLQERRRDEP